jgi:hypothetical protein
MMKGLWMLSALWCTLATTAVAAADKSESSSTVTLRRSLVGRPVDATTEATRRLHVQSLRLKDGSKPIKPLQRRRLSARQRRKLPGTCVTVYYGVCVCRLCVVCVCVPNRFFAIRTYSTISVVCVWSPTMAPCEYSLHRRRY